MLKTLSALTITMFAFACGGGGGGSGVSDSKTIVSLSADERTDVCTHWVDLLGPARTITCGGETEMVGGEAASECITELGQLATEAPMCGITVGQYEGCIEAIAGLTDAEICAGDTFPPECSVLITSPNCGGA